MQIIIRLFVSILVFALVACDDSGSAQTKTVAGEASPSMESRPETSVVELAEEKTDLSGSERLEKSLSDIEERMGIDLFVDPWTGDLDRMAKERVIRVLTVYGVGRYYLERAEEKGITYEWFKQFEDFINKKLGNKHLRVHVVFIPVARDQLIPVSYTHLTLPTTLPRCISRWSPYH